MLTMFLKNGGTCNEMGEFVCYSRSLLQEPDLLLPKSNRLIFVVF